MGLCNAFGVLSGCIAPQVTGYLTNDNTTREQYRKVFLLAAGVSVVGGTFFNVFVSGEQQEWNNDTEIFTSIVYSKILSTKILSIRMAKFKES